MADLKPGEIQRNLEGAGNLYISRFTTGLYKNRSPLYTPISAMGVSMIERQDVLWDGANIQVTPQYTLRRRPGFVASSTAGFSSNEWPLEFFGFENLSGNIAQIVDTQGRVSIFNATSLSPICNKAAAAAQTEFNSVANTMYFCDGVDAFKYTGPNLLLQSNTFTTTWGEAHATFTGSQTDPNGGTTATKVVWGTTGVTAAIMQTVTPNYTPVASNNFTFSVWMKENGSANTVTLLIEDQSNNVIATQVCVLTSSWVRYTVSGTMGGAATAIQTWIYNPTSTNAITIYGAQLEVGNAATPYQSTATLPQGVSLWGITAPISAPTLSYTGSGSLSPKVGYKYGYTYKNSATGHVSTMSPASASTGPLANQTVTQKVTVPATGPYTVTVTHGATMVSDGGVVFDATAAALTAVVSGPVAGQYIAGAAGTGTYTFSSANASAVLDITYTFSLVASTGVNIVVGGPHSADPQVDTVQIYRTLDGGSQYFLDTEIANPGTGSWTYTDSTADASLNSFISAPLAFVNNPPPAGASNVVWYGGRLWVVVGNTIYFSAGPDATNGSGQESFPPGNNYALVGDVNAWAATSQGLVIWTKDDAYVLTGTSSATYTTPILWQSNWGVATQNSVTQDGDNIFIFTTRGQVYNFSANGLSEIGIFLEDQFAAMTPSKVYIAVHRSGSDEGVFVSDGSANIYRYSQFNNAWDTVMQPVGGCSAIASMECADGVYRLMLGQATGAGPIVQRTLGTYTDNGTAYAAFATLGSILVAPPRQVAVIASVLLQLTGITGATYPTLSVMLNETADIGTAPATFTILPNPVPDPPQLAVNVTNITKRHDLAAAQTPLPQHVQHMQIKIAFTAEAFGNEVRGIGIAHKN